MSLIEQLVEDIVSERFSLTEAGIFQTLEKIPTMNFDLESQKRIESKLMKVGSQLRKLINIQQDAVYLKEIKNFIDCEDNETPIDRLVKGQKYIFFNHTFSTIAINLVIIDEIGDEFMYPLYVHNQKLSDGFREMFGRYHIETFKLKDISWNVRYSFYRVLPNTHKN